ncbi:SMI1/KNR4 family protein [Nocardiopsis mangrovi]|uniref:SMI1/KNR4 family protein n=1 Tax=Nocardiopsis mangrovi TaxID=1179818 RepID=A0ABV9DYK5_9ACTN
MNEDRVGPLRPRLTTPDQWREFLGVDFAAVTCEGCGHEPATHEQVDEAERRLEPRTPLPPSYRAFLTTTNGWDELGNWCGRALPAQEIQWAADLHPYLADLYEDDEEYGPLLAAALTVNDGEDLWLLDPREVDADGEWAAYVFKPKYGDFDKAGSFSDLWHDNYG